jgi:hypothetical protein
MTDSSNRWRLVRRGLPVLALLALAPIAGLRAEAPAAPAGLAGTAESVGAELIAHWGEGRATEIRRGIAQVRSLWRGEDGDAEAFASFVRENWIGVPSERDELFERFEQLLESVDGHMSEIRRDLLTRSDLDLGPLRPWDLAFANSSLAAHVDDDLFASKVAFVALLNFPLSPLPERLEKGGSWSRRAWAECRLAARFSHRVPAEVQRGVDEAFVASSAYIAGYNFRMHHVLPADGSRLFPEGLRLLSHWNLRDEIKALYAAKNGLDRQRLLQLVMEKIVRQEVPKVVLDNPFVDWAPATGRLAQAPPSNEKGADGVVRPPDPIPAATEGFERYARILANFRALAAADPFSPNLPTFVDRKFEEEREIPEAEVRRLLVSVLDAPIVPKVARLVSSRLGRKLEPFDIWYSGFRQRPPVSEEELDRITRAKYPTAAAFEQDLPRILRGIGFAPDTAAFLASRISVDPARGSGHALGAERRGDRAHLRTRVPEGGMTYKGYNIAIHELGHNVEQTFSLERIDHWLLRGVPNSAFTEALAFVFQSRDLELLGLGTSPSPDDRHLAALESFWSTYEIAGVALIEMDTWRWMYAHRTATPEELGAAVLQIAREVWNRHYAPIFGRKNVELLAIYSHLVNEALYLPDYPLGHVIAWQIERSFDGKNLATEIERVARIGSVTPDFWMRQATGSPISTEPLLRDAGEALDFLAKRKGRK